MKKHKIDMYTGFGKFENNNILNNTDSKNAKIQLASDKFIIATGSKPTSLKGIILDKSRIITSTEALNLSEIPKHLIIIGGGVIGLELGSVYSRLGSKISVIEFTDAIIGSMNRTMGKELEKVLKKNGFEFYLNHKVISATVKGKEVQVTARNNKGDEVSFTGDYCLVSVERKPYTENLGLEKAGVKIDDTGKVVVNENLQTTAVNIYAVFHLGVGVDVPRRGGNMQLVTRQIHISNLDVSD